MKSLLKLLLLAMFAVAMFGYAGWKKLTAPAAPAAPAGASKLQPGNAATPAGKVQAFQALKAQAQAGHAVSQRLVAQAYDICFPFNQNRQGYLRTRAEILASKTDPAERDYFERVSAARLEDCDAVNDGVAATPQQIIDAYAQAARSGDLAARAMHYALADEKVDPETGARFLQDVAASGDPAAVFAVGYSLNYMDFGGYGSAFSPLTHTPRSGEVWMIAACRMGYPCGAESPLVADECAVVGVCPQDTFDGRVLRTGSAGERAALERHVQMVLAVVQRGRGA